MNHTATIAADNNSAQAAWTLAVAVAAAAAARGNSTRAYGACPSCGDWFSHCPSCSACPNAGEHAKNCPNALHR